MTRRDYGSGAMYQRTSDWRWVATIASGWTDQGTRSRPTVTGKGCVGGCPERCHHRAEIKRKVADRKRQIERDGASTASPNATVKSWADEWLTIKERELRPASYNATRSAVRKWIVPTIGHRKLALLTPGDIRAVATAQREAGLAGTSQLRTHSTLIDMLKAAMAEGYTVPARLLVVKGPGRGTSDRTALTVPEALGVLEQATKIPHGSRWVAALLQGMRQGESLGLTWSEVDLTNGNLTISWQLQPLPYRVARDRSSGFRVPDGYEARQLAGRLHLVRPKSKKGWRVIPLVPWMHSALTAWRESCPESPHDLVWPTADGRPRLAKDDDEEWYALQAAAKVKHPGGRHYYIHEARHTTATLLMEAGVEPSVIEAILGHSSIVTSRGYMHANTTHTRAAMEKVAKRLQLG
jgi:integrase